MVTVNNMVSAKRLSSSDEYLDVAYSQMLLKKTDLSHNVDK